MRGKSTHSSVLPGFNVLLHLGSYLFVGFLFFRVFTHGLRMVFALGAYDSVTRLVCIGFGRMSTNSTTRTGISASGVFTCATFCFSTWNSFRIFKFRHSVTRAIRISFRLAARFSHLACITNYLLIRMALGCKSREWSASTRVSASGV